MKCSHCKAQQKPADLYRWDLRLCADNRRKRVFRLCDDCDVELNRHILIVMGDRNAAAKIAKYRARA